MANCLCPCEDLDEGLLRLKLISYPAHVQLTACIMLLDKPRAERGHVGRTGADGFHETRH